MGDNLQIVIPLKIEFSEAEREIKNWIISLNKEIAVSSNTIEISLGKLAQTMNKTISNAKTFSYSIDNVVSSIKKASEITNVTNDIYSFVNKMKSASSAINVAMGGLSTVISLFTIAYDAYTISRQKAEAVKKEFLEDTLRIIDSKNKDEFTEYSLELAKIEAEKNIKGAKFNKNRFLRLSKQKNQEALKHWESYEEFSRKVKEETYDFYAKADYQREADYYLKEHKKARVKAEDYLLKSKQYNADYLKYKSILEYDGKNITPDLPEENNFIKTNLFTNLIQPPERVELESFFNTLRDIEDIENKIQSIRNKKELSQTENERIHFIKQEIELQKQLKEQHEELLKKQEASRKELINKFKEIAKGTELEDVITDFEILEINFDKFNKLTPQGTQKVREFTDSVQKLDQNLVSTKDSMYEAEKATGDLAEEIERANIKWEKQANAVADEVIGIYKDFYQTKKELELEAIDEQLEKEEKRHIRVISHLDEELDKYEETTNAKLKLLEREDDEEAFAKQLSSLQDERAQLQSSLNLLSLDDSIEAKFKREELAKQIAEKEEEIEELKSQRTKEIRKQNLLDQLDAYRKDVEEKKKAENNKYEAVRDSLQDQKEYWNNFYDDLINNEIKFAEIRRQIIQGNLADIKADLEQFKNEIRDNRLDIGTNAANSAIDKIDRAENKLDRTKKSKPQYTNNPSSKSKSWHAAWFDEKYLTEKQKEDKAYAISLYGKDKLRDSLLSRVKNSEKGKQQDILNYAKKIGLALNYYHDGGTVGGRAFNPRTEEIAKLLKGEEIFSKQQLLRVPNILGNVMKYSLTDIQKYTQPNTVFNVSMNIDKLTGDKEGSKIMFNEFVNLLKTNHGAAF